MECESPHLHTLQLVKIWNVRVRIFTSYNLWKYRMWEFVSSHSTTYDLFMLVVGETSIWHKKNFHLIRNGGTVYRISYQRVIQRFMWPELDCSEQKSLGGNGFMSPATATLWLWPQAGHVWEVIVSSCCFQTRISPVTTRLASGQRWMEQTSFFFYLIFKQM